MCPNCHPLQQAAVLYISTAIKNRPFHVPGHGAYWECSYSDTGFIGGRLLRQSPTTGEEVVNMADKLTVPRRGEQSPADSPTPPPHTVRLKLCRAAQLWGVGLGFRSLSPHPPKKETFYYLTDPLLVNVLGHILFWEVPPCCCVMCQVCDCKSVCIDIQLKAPKQSKI